MIEPFFFGKRGALAFYHPSADPSSTELLVVCPPLFDEYRRSYRALSDLANACASHSPGPHVMRIDYSGTGEAEGVLSDATVGDWLDDINLAIEDGMALTGADRVMLMGVRFGATLAAQCRHSAIDNYLLWDPLPTGAEYLRWLEKVDALVKSRHVGLARQINRKREEIPYVCFELSQKMKLEMARLTIDDLYATRAEKTWVVETRRRADQNVGNVKCEFGGFEYDWPEYHEGNLIPKPVLELIAKRVIQR